jgi:hypothetical protein
MDGIKISIFVKLPGRSVVEVSVPTSDTVHHVYTRIQEMFHLSSFTLTYLGVPVNHSLGVSTFHQCLFVVDFDSPEKKKDALRKVRHAVTQSKWIQKQVHRPTKKSMGRSGANRSKFLSHVCEVPSQCLALGRYLDELNSYFQYTTFKYAVKSPMESRVSGGSGSIYDVEYKRNGYTSYAILKCGIGGDSLFYEFLVGHHFINAMNVQFPCFISTYGLYYGRYYGHFDLKALQQDEPNYATACSRTDETCILIQGVHQAKQLLHYHSDKTFLQQDLLFVLYIVYQALSSLSTQFTHYDLSEQNVILLKLPEPMEYVYENITFRTRYIPKIIDYARAFFDNGKINSKQIYKNICSTVECNEISPCGEDIGFSWLDPVPWAMISSQVKNESHDLRLLYSLGISRQKSTHSWGVLDSLFPKIVYGKGVSPDKQEYGTSENLTIHPDRITNVKGAMIELESLIRKKQQVYRGKVDRLIIRKGLPMEFVPR